MDLEACVDSRLIVIWGSNPITSNLHFWTRAQEAKRRGARLVAIDPYRSATAEKCHEHIALMPGTDAALAYGVMHVLIRDRRIDVDYVERHTDRLRRARAARAGVAAGARGRVCGISVAQVERLAHDLGTIKPAAIRLNYGMQRHAGGGNAVRTVACLPGAHRRVARPRRRRAAVLVGHLPGRHHGARAPGPDPWAIRARSTCRRSATRSARPIRRCARSSSTTATRSPSRPSRRRWCAASRATTCSSSCTTCSAPTRPTTRTSCCPATSQLEHLDVHHSYGHLHVQANNPSIDPLGESLPNTEVFRRLAAAMGFDEPCFRDSDDDIARQAFRRDDPRMAATTGTRSSATASGACRCPSTTHRSRTAGSRRRRARASSRAPARRRPVTIRCPRSSCRASPRHTNPRSPRASRSRSSRRRRATSSTRRSRTCRSFVAEEREPRLVIHPDDAAPRAIVPGDPVRIHNDRGAFRATAQVTERARPGVVVAPSIWWRKLAPAARTRMPSRPGADRPRRCGDVLRLPGRGDPRGGRRVTGAGRPPPARRVGVGPPRRADRGIDGRARARRARRRAARRRGHRARDGRPPTPGPRPRALPRRPRRRARARRDRRARGLPRGARRVPGGARRLGRADALRGIGQVYDTLGDAPQALAHHLRALAIAEAAGDRARRPRRCAPSASSIRAPAAPTSVSSGTRRSLALPGPDADPLERARTLNNIGINLKNLGRFDESLATLESALDAFRAADATLGQAGALNNLGATLERMGRLDEAERKLRDALERSTSTGYGEGVVNASLGLGRVCDRTARPAEAHRASGDRARRRPASGAARLRSRGARRARRPARTLRRVGRGRAAPAARPRDRAPADVGSLRPAPQGAVDPLPGHRGAARGGAHAREAGRAGEGQRAARGAQPRPRHRRRAEIAPRRRVGAADARGQPHRSREPSPARPAPRRRIRPGGALRPARSPSRSPTSTISRTSTTAGRTPPATRC